MSATVYALRPFQSAVQQAHRAGVPADRAIAEVRAEQQAGRIGNNIAGKYRAMAWRPSGPSNGGSAA